jgi:hypothetical protein
MASECSLTALWRPPGGGGTTPLGPVGFQEWGAPFRPPPNFEASTPSSVDAFKLNPAGHGKALGIGTCTVQRVVMEQPRPFGVDVAEAAFASQHAASLRSGERRSNVCAQAHSGIPAIRYASCNFARS